MANESAQTQNSIILAAVVLQNQKVQAGSTFLVEAQNEEEQKKLTTEIAKAVKGDVTRLSNGIYLILKG